MLEKEIAKEITISAIGKIDTRFGGNVTAVEKNELYAQEVGKLYKEVFKAVVEATEDLNNR